MLNRPVFTSDELLKEVSTTPNQIFRDKLVRRLKVLNDTILANEKGMIQAKQNLSKFIDEIDNAYDQDDLKKLCNKYGI